MSVASAPKRLGLRTLIQGGALVLRASWRAAPWLTLVGLVLAPAAQVMTMLGALWLALLTDAVLGHELVQALVAAGLMGVSAAAFFVVYGREPAGAVPSGRPGRGRTRPHAGRDHRGDPHHRAPRAARVPRSA